MVAAIDDEQTMMLSRLFNEPAGHEYLARRGVAAEVVEQLPLVGISGICNLVSNIKAAKYYDMDSRDVLFCPLTDAMSLYESRLEEMNECYGPFTAADAAAVGARYLDGTATDNLRELSYLDRKSLHHFKYFTWVEQQGRSSEELNRLWDEEFWQETFAQEQVDEWDGLIDQFNQATGLLAKL